MGGLGYPGGRVPGGRLTDPPPPTRVHCGSRYVSNWNGFFGLIHLLPYVIDFSKHPISLITFDKQTQLITLECL